jgi:hypothetical protein
MKLISFILFFNCFTIFGQITTKNQIYRQDSSILSKHTPKKAAFWSFIIPGAGQIYNQHYSPKGRYGAYWKVPLIYVALVGSSSLFIDAVRTESEIRTEYNNRQEIKIVTPSIKWENYTSNDLILLHESAVRKRTMYGLLVGGVYALQIIEASIDAHFLHFDISPNITMQLQPTYLQRTAGIQLTFNFN